MNSLSWLIYLADALPSLGVFATLLATFSGVATAIFIVGFIVTVEDDNDRKTCISVLKLTVPILVVGSLLAVTIPSHKTIMMIAASEFGEEIALSSQAKNLGGKSYKALDKFLSDYLEEKE